MGSLRVYLKQEVNIGAAREEARLRHMALLHDEDLKLFLTPHPAEAREEIRAARKARQSAKAFNVPEKCSGCEVRPSQFPSGFCSVCEAEADELITDERVRQALGLRLRDNKT